MNLDELERQIKERLYDLQMEYYERAKPYLDQLVRIEQMRPSAPFVVMMDALTPGQREELERLGTRLLPITSKPPG